MAWQRLRDAAAGDAGVLGELAAAAGVRIAREGAALVVDDHQLAKRPLLPICWLCRLAPFLEGFHMIDVVVKVAPNAAAKARHRKEHRDRQARREAVAVGAISEFPFVREEGEKVVRARDRDPASAELGTEEAPETDIGFTFEVVKPVGLAC